MTYWFKCHHARASTLRGKAGSVVAGCLGRIPARRADGSGGRIRCRQDHPHGAQSYPPVQSNTFDRPSLFPGIQATPDHCQRAFDFSVLKDVLAGRKTGGKIEGEILISGHPKEQESFRRISGSAHLPCSTIGQPSAELTVECHAHGAAAVEASQFRCSSACVRCECLSPIVHPSCLLLGGRYVEQDDIHSPQTTVREALSFSGHLRLPKDQSKRDVEAFVDQVRWSTRAKPMVDCASVSLDDLVAEGRAGIISSIVACACLLPAQPGRCLPLQVMDLVELTPLRNTLVGLPGASGLSVEQRKRLTIAVELVPSFSTLRQFDLISWLMSCDSHAGTAQGQAQHQGSHIACCTRLADSCISVMQVSNPSIIFMDEPTSGAKPHCRQSCPAGESDTHTDAVLIDHTTPIPPLCLCWVG